MCSSRDHKTNPFLRMQFLNAVYKLRCLTWMCVRTSSQNVRNFRMALLLDIFENLRKVLGNLWKIVKNVVICIFMIINKIIHGGLLIRNFPSRLFRSLRCARSER